MMPAKVSTLGLLKKRYFEINVIISVHGVANKILSRDSNYIVVVVISPKFGNSSIPLREVIVTSFL